MEEVFYDFMYRHKWVPGFLATRPPAVLFFLGGVTRVVVLTNLSAGVGLTAFQKAFLSQERRGRTLLEPSFQFQIARGWSVAISKVYSIQAAAFIKLPAARLFSLKVAAVGFSED